jgi:crotonobetainyl-CoA:carnitine CoA-transferase CaiB-like acyl-CoA transferase
MTEAGAIARGPGEMMRNADPGMLAGVRVIDLGAEVVKIEPPEGNATRRIGPFLEENRPGLPAVLPELHRDKKSVVLDLQEPRGARICSACSGAPIFSRMRRAALGFRSW